MSYWGLTKVVGNPLMIVSVRLANEQVRVGEVIPIGQADG
jgi:hypothetical protein